ncbi:MAG: beta-lactamase family protein [Verrucomicrobia bacterium]|nr:beta-lactamase family protein [Verrucomicrobiota bacterium]
MSSPRVHRYAVFLLAALFVSARAAEPTALERAISQAREIVTTKLAPKVPGLSVAVGVDGAIVWSEGFGFADLAAKRPVTRDTRFRIGSISKSIAAAGLMLLVERGQLDLDAPVQKYLPDFPVKSEGVITTRLLAGHLAGIRHYNGEAEMLLNRPFANVHAGLAIFAADPVVAPPGTKFHYSTYGWTVISAAMETAAREDFLPFMEKNVFGPLKLAHTRADRAGAPDPDRTEFYQGQPGKFTVAPPVDNSYKWAGGGFLSNTEDLVRFGTAHLQPGFLKAASLAAMFTPQKTTDGKPTTYGIGWVVNKDARGHRILMHTGGSIGGTSVLLLHPESKTVVAMVCNHSRSPFAKEAYEAIAEIFSQLFAPR